MIYKNIFVLPFSVKQYIATATLTSLVLQKKEKNTISIYLTTALFLLVKINLLQNDNENMKARL